MRNVVLLILFSPLCSAQSLAPLTVGKIMRDPRWMGVSPSGIFWSDDSRRVYFNWNPERHPGDSLYSIATNGPAPQKVEAVQRRALPGRGVYNALRTQKVFEKNGDVFLLDIRSGKITAVTQTVERETNAEFSADDKKILFTAGLNLFSWDIATGAFAQLTDFRKGAKKQEAKATEQEKWLKQDQLAYIQVLRERAEKKKAAAPIQKADQPRRPKEIYIDDKNVDQITLSPDGQVITYRLTRNAAGAKSTAVPNYVTESGFTENIATRPKVGAPQNTQELFVYLPAKDTVILVNTGELPGIFDAPEFSRQPGAAAVGNEPAKKTPRPLSFGRVNWSPDGRYNFLTIRAFDNKDRWIASLDAATQKLQAIDRQRDEAWIGGPAAAPNTTGWLADNQTIWFLSEETGYAHLYLYNLPAARKQALTTGKYEVQSVELAPDKKFFFLTTNEVHPGEKHFYRLPVGGGRAERITTMTGASEVTVSPDGRWLAIRHSYSTRPWELFLQENRPGATPRQITSSVSNEFKSYPWRDPELVTFTARDGAAVYTRLYRPAKPNGAAVIFVHGAGYLQNAHKWWSNYFREYMFHNLLADNGYTVIDLDYRASAGYGRDWRTGIYRFMGGKDLTDHVDGAKWLVQNYQIDPKRIGIYGGSYGGFITLMALFTEPDVFAAGAALRPVTDWAHYNHGYTSNILNEPFTDSLAYAKSSPIYHAAGLKGHLLMCHGMVDVNVHFQDVVRLSQRLIELGKDNWELAVYPLEDHGFVEPSSWTDQYKRILNLFNNTLR
jgi:dipeptidyl aminopeptidase/acylaminoacyl peptidase